MTATFPSQPPAPLRMTALPPRMPRRWRPLAWTAALALATAAGAATAPNGPHRKVAHDPGLYGVEPWDWSQWDFGAPPRRAPRPQPPPPGGGPDSQVIAHWLTASSGSWFDPARWDTNPTAPNNGGGSTYHAIIDAAGPAYTVSLAAPATLDALTLNSSTATLSIDSGGVLSVLGSASVGAGTLRINGGTVNGGTFSFTGGSLAAGVDSGSLLDGVTINGSVHIGEQTVIPNLVRIQNGLTLNGTLDIGGASSPQGASLIFEGDQNLSTGTFVFSGDGFARGLAVDGDSTLTLGPGVTVRGSNGRIGSQVLNTGSNTVINQGLISADDTNTRPLTVASITFLNTGTARAINSGVLSLNAASWTNTGTLSVSGSGTLNLGGGFTTAGIGTVSRSGGTINITGVMDNSASTFILNAGTGDYFLRGGTINGGVITTSGAELRMTSVSGSRLNGVTMNGNLDLAGTFGFLTLAGQNTLNGTLSVGLGSVVTFDQTSTLAAGTVAMQGGTLDAPNSSTLTLAAPVVVNTTPRLSPPGAATNVIGGNLITNHGLISATGSQNLTRVEPMTLTSDGTLEVLNGASLVLGYQLQSTLGTWSNSGLIHVDNGNLILRGSFTTPGLGTIQRNGGNIWLEGSLDNTNSALTFNSGSGSWQLRGGQITGGVLNFTQGAGLNFQPTAASGSVGGILRNTTVNGDITLQGNGSLLAGLQIYDGLAMNGTIHIAGPGDTLTFFNNQTFNSGTISLEGFSGASRLVTIADNTILTIGPNAWIHGGGGAISGSSSPTIGLVNHGRITSDIAGRTFALGGGNGFMSSDGMLEVAPGSTMSLSGNWTSTGIIRNNGTLNLGGTGRIAGSTFDGVGGLINVSGTIDNSNAVLSLTGAAQSWNMVGGRISGGTVNLLQGANLIMSSGPSGNGATLLNTTLNGSLTLTGNLNAPTLTVERALNLNGTITLSGSGTRMYVLPTAANPVSINGGTIVLAGGTNQRQVLDFSGTGTLTLGPTTTVRGGGRGGPYGGSAIGHSAPSTSPFTVINQGLISADILDQFLTVETKYLTNQGTMQALNGGYLYITPETTWTNTGLIRSSPGSNVVLGGLVSTSGLGTVQANGGDVTIGGTLDNSGSVLTLNQSTGSWQLSLGSLANGMIKHGVVNLLDGTNLRFNNGQGFLDSVTVNGDLDFLPYGRLDVMNNLTLNGTAHLRSSNAIMEFRGDQVFSTGTVSFEGTDGNMRILQATSGSALTLGSTAVVHGGYGMIYTGETSTVLNQGLISADVNGQAISIYTSRFTNQGTIQAINGGIITYVPPLGPGDPLIFTNEGFLRIDAGSLFEWAGPFIQSAQGTMTIQLIGSETMLPGRVSLLDTVDLAGTLRVTLAPDFRPAFGERFAILSIAQGHLSGAFGLLDLPALNGGLLWDTSQLYQSGTIGVVPAPASLLVLGLFLAASRRRRTGVHS